jgi:hypothetical protein
MQALRIIIAIIEKICHTLHYEYRLSENILTKLRIHLWIMVFERFNISQFNYKTLINDVESLNALEFFNTNVITLRPDLSKYVKHV